MNYGTLLSLLQTFIKKLFFLIYYLLILNGCSLLFCWWECNLRWYDRHVNDVQQMFRVDRHFVFAFTFISVMHKWGCIFQYKLNHWQIHITSMYIFNFGNINSRETTAKYQRFLCLHSSFIIFKTLMIDLVLYCVCVCVWGGGGGLTWNKKLSNISVGLN